MKKLDRGDEMETMMGDESGKGVKKGVIERESDHRLYPKFDDGTSSNEIKIGTSLGVEPQDADYSHTPSLNYHLEDSILARVPRSEYWKFCAVNKRFLTMLKSGQIYKIREEIGFREPSVFMLATGETSWWSFDRQFKSCRKLPVLPWDICFTSGDKESLCAGTHLIVSGMGIDGPVIWRYDLVENKWFKGPSMINPRCLFASATCGNCAFVAGGIGTERNKEVLRTAERYNPETKSWDRLPMMRKQRKLCSGCYMDKKFYVIGGKNGRDQDLTCGEAFDESKNKWELIPDMLKDMPISDFHSPPLVAVVNNELYMLESSTNEVKVYDKIAKSWKRLGQVPIRADFNKGWGVAFKSLGNELLVIGASSVSVTGNGMTIYTCCPDPSAHELQWKSMDCIKNGSSHFILNCSVMVA